MRATRSTLALIALVGSVLLVGCSGSSDGAASSDSSSTTVNDADFEQSAKELSAAVEGAGTDICAVNSSLSDMFALPSPTTPEQAKESVVLLVTMLNSVADALPAESAASAESIRSAATSLAADAEANNYDPAWLAGGSAITQDSGFLAGLAEFQSLAAETCETPGTAPIDTPTGG